MNKTIEDKIIDLQIRISQQEDMIEELNKVIFRQQTKIDNFESLLKELASRVIEIESENPVNEKPPHY